MRLMEISIPQNTIIQITACYNWPGEEAAKVYLDAVSLSLQIFNRHHD